ncbi:MAG: O-antigen ligase family protein [Hyphomonadaceae bacterium]|nr:O-antigen ligase family protein [Hyphomonadaceae bacterium]MBY0565251.1 O-antigen ligase family protein [Hyphomonadaceae bacterium]
MVILLGLILQGGDTHVLNALLASALLACAALAVACAPSPVLRDVFAVQGFSIFLGASFLVWCALTAWPLLPALHERFAHPLSEFFLWRAPGVSLSPTETLLGVVFMMAPGAAFFLGAMASVEPRARVWGVRALALVALMFSLVSLGDFARASAGRLDAGLSSPNVAAALFGGLGLLSLSVALRAARRSNPNQALPRALGFLQGVVSAPFSAAAAFMAFMCVMLTASRGGALAVGVGLIVFVAAFALRTSSPSKSGFSMPRLVLGLALPIVFVVLASLDTLLTRFGEGEAAIVGRQQLLAAHLETFSQRPILGHGLNTYDQLNLLAMTLENMGPLRQAGAAHNIFVQSLEETGVVGFGLIFLAVAACLLRTLVKVFTSNRSLEWNAALLGISTVFLVHGAFDFALQVPAVGALYAYVLGLLTPRPWD